METNATTNEDIRQKIIEAARARFNHYGYNKTTMAEIANDTGMSAANLYRYFKSKQDISATCASKHMAERIELMRNAVRKPNLNAVERLHCYVLTTLHYFYEVASENRKINESIEVLMNERPELIQQKIETEISLLAEILAFGNETGEFNVEDVIATAKTVHVTLILFQVPMFMNLYSLEQFEKMAIAVVQLLADGLAKK